jgi:hypothetical protein
MVEGSTMEPLRRTLAAAYRRFTPAGRRHEAVVQRQERLGQELDELRVAVGRLHSRLVPAGGDVSLREAEFKVFSQWGEDGIIQHLIRTIAVPNDVFVEIGVGDYRESNTRFLLVNDNWRGLIIDPGRRHVDFIAKGDYAWRWDIQALSALVTAENVNPLVASAGIGGDIGLLSIDVDGVDYWILEALTVVSPRILIVEYNSLFGPDHAVTVPYRADFDWTRAHSSHLCWGASLAALCRSARRKGYTFVGSNRAGNNAFFVRADVRGPLREVSPQRGYVPSRFRISTDETGRLTGIGPHADQLQLIADREVYDVERQRLVRIHELFGLPRS